MSHPNYPSYAEDTIGAFVVVDDEPDINRRLFRLTVQTLFRATKIIPYRLPSNLQSIVIAGLSVEGRQVLPLTDAPIPLQVFLDHQPALPAVAPGGKIEIDVRSESPLQSLGFAIVGKRVR